MSERLVVDGLKVAVGDKEILKGVSLEVRVGEVCAVMGPNGSGKSTLAYAVMGHPGYEVREGKAEIVSSKDRVNLLSLSTEKRARAGVFLGFQNPMAIPGVSVFSLLRTSYEGLHGGLTDGEKRLSVVEFFDLVKRKAKSFGISEEFLKRSINDGFSGGEKKKMEVLQLAVLAPRFAILDEPDTGLDVDALKVVSRGIKERADGGGGVLVITHYTRILKYLAPRAVYVLKEGKLVASGDYKLAQKIERDGYETVGS